MEKQPIFIGVTRSFWFGILPAALTALDMIFAGFAGDAAYAPFAQIITVTVGQVFGWTSEQVQGVMVSLAPLYALIVAQQRAGTSRPYTVDPTATK